MRTLLTLSLFLATTMLHAQPAVQTTETHEDDRVVLKSALDSVSYAIGLNLGLQAAKDSIRLSPAALTQGMRDADDTAAAQLNDSEILDVMLRFQRELNARKVKLDSIAAGMNAAAGEAFLKRNASMPGVRTLPVGVQYRIVREGSGRKPRRRDSVVVRYSGRLIDGTPFESFIESEQPATLALDAVMSGLAHAMLNMKIGSKWEVFVPTDLAYGEQKAGDIPPNSTLVFDVELLDIAR